MGTPANQPAAQSDDERAIGALLERLAESWAAGDADAYADAFAPDADYIIFDGSRHTGRRAIAESHRPLFERFLKGSRLVTVSSSLRFLTPDIAVIHSQGAVLKKGQRAISPGRLSAQTTVVARQADGWRIAAFQNTRYRPFSKTLLGRLLSLAGIAPKPAANAAASSGR